jgi:hypothetical protein
VLFADSASLIVEWQLADGSGLTLVANLSAARTQMRDMGAASASVSRGRTLYQTSNDLREQLQAGSLPAWSVAFLLRDAPAAKDR